MCLCAHVPPSVGNSAKLGQRLVQYGYQLPQFQKTTPYPKLPGSCPCKTNKQKLWRFQTQSIILQGRLAVDQLVTLVALTSSTEQPSSKPQSGCSAKSELLGWPASQRTRFGHIRAINHVRARGSREWGPTSSDLGYVFFPPPIPPFFWSQEAPANPSPSPACASWPPPSRPRQWHAAAGP